MSLAKGKSPRFGSNPSNYPELVLYQSVAVAGVINLATRNNSLTHYAKGTLSHSKLIELL